MAELRPVGCCLASPHRSALRMVKEREGLKAAESEIHSLILGMCCFWKLAASSARVPILGVSFSCVQAALRLSAEQGTSCTGGFVRGARH